ncbi:putative nuclease HARBI1 [Ixodes scapularis]|uniref:putative nuclease HARBI1 n=1 Tax=Ixodes scapularis TaxID=6945 RepID=UPI001A9F15A3|nr:putative nuclease HARBI1 [Ixodes scapularis]
MSQTSASRIINTVSGALCELAKSGMKFPATSRAALLTARGFLEINGFPKVLGCIDGTHIALKIAKQDQHIYRNRKGYDSLNVQAICNASKEITQLTPWLMTPFRKFQKKEEENYNDGLTKTRQVIERTFGIMKSRFRCLDRSGGVLQYSPGVCCRLIVACAVLHNYCTRHHISLAEPPVEESDDEEEEEEDRPSTAQDTPSGKAVRNELVNTVFKDNLAIYKLHVEVVGFKCHPLLLQFYNLVQAFNNSLLRFDNLVAMVLHVTCT